MLEDCQVTMKSGQESWLLLMCSVDKGQLSEKAILTEGCL